MWKFSRISVGLFSATFSLLAASAPTTVVYQKFDSPSLPAGWGFGSQNGGSVGISTDTGKNFSGSSGSIKGSYPIANGDGYVWGSYSLAPLNTRDIYVEFWAKMPNAKQGLKFLKVFGAYNGTNNYANTSFSLDATGIETGGMVYVAFGDGTATANDTQNGVWLAGTNDSERAYHGVGRSANVATILTPQNSVWPASAWGKGWHRFRFHVKFNSGTTAANEVPDGEVYAEIDGLVYVNAKGIFNRHYTNLPIDRVELFGWAQSGTTPFEVWYDNVRISTGGFVEP